MAVQTDAYLKGRFITGAKPTQTDFSDLIDSKRSVNDNLAISDVTGLQTALDNAGGGSVAWGDVTGTLSNQTDLNTALSGKSDTSHTHTAATTSAAGFMSSADKTKLNGLDANLQVPSGGTAGQFVRKGASAPEWADVIQVPTGGTDGQVVTKVAGVPAWADAAGGGGGGVWEEIGSITVDTASQVSTFSSIPTTYKRLKLLYQGARVTSVITNFNNIGTLNTDYDSFKSRVSWFNSFSNSGPFQTSFTLPLDRAGSGLSELSFDLFYVNTNTVLIKGISSDDDSSDCSIHTLISRVVDTALVGGITSLAITTSMVNTSFGGQFKLLGLV